MDKDDNKESRKNLKDALNSCLQLFDEAENILKDEALPSFAPTSTTFDFENIVQDIYPSPFDEVTVERSTVSQLSSIVNYCQDCPACKNRKNVLFGEGPIPAKLMVIGEGPGFEEDKTGRLFVGKSGLYLESWLKPISLDLRRDVYLSNVVKCYSGTNPTPSEVASCMKYIERQIQLVKPEAILILGKIAANSLLKTNSTLSDMRGKILRYNNVPLIVTYHPAAVLRNPEWKKPVWEDLKKIATILDLPINGRRS